MSKRYLLVFFLVVLFVICVVAISQSVISNESAFYKRNPREGTVYDRRPQEGSNEAQKEHPPCDPGLEKHLRPFGPGPGGFRP